MPNQPVVIPPPTGPQPPTPAEPVVQAAAGPTRAEIERNLSQAQAARHSLGLAVEGLTTAVSGLEAALAASGADQQRRADDLVTARARLRRRAIASYVSTPVAPLNQVVEATDFVDLTRRAAMVDAVMDADRTSVRDHELAKRKVGDEIQRLAIDLDRSRAALATATVALQQADAELLGKAIQLDAVQAGIRLVTGGFLFPVAGPHTFSDTFGDPRMPGTPYAHAHQGTDVFAAPGTPLVTVERGVLVGVGTDLLGGTKLWLAGASGTRYYYAHLSGFAPGVAEAKVVSAGEVIGYVGDSGNARGTSAHLHFEVHPGGGAAINPFPLLKIADEAERRAAPSAQR